MAARPDLSAPVLQTLHATAVAYGPRGLLILGRSGAGKSTLALELLGLGATLIADDRVTVTPDPGAPPHLTAPTSIAGVIEARGIGLLRQPHHSARLTDVLDLDVTEVARLPEAREMVIAGHPVPCLARVEHPAFASMVMAYLKGGRAAP